MNSGQKDDRNIKHEHESGEFIYFILFFIFHISYFQFPPFPTEWFIITDMEFFSKGLDVDIIFNDHTKFDEDTGIDTEKEWRRKKTKKKIVYWCFYPCFKMWVH